MYEVHFSLPEIFIIKPRVCPQTAPTWRAVVLCTECDTAQSQSHSCTADLNSLPAGYHSQDSWQCNGPDDHLVCSASPCVHHYPTGGVWFDCWNYKESLRRAEELISSHFVHSHEPRIPRGEKLRHSLERSPGREGFRLKISIPLK